ncbi:rho GTPase-activating protein 30 [Ambystoma mexicanum]|uniref:rho GTPase-activating protein 30 n=1 Tax=Ambystoma mexicanum TaxID=8296 RepID=UPI0037E8C7D3
MKARQKAKKKAATKDRVFGCDLLEHVRCTGQDVPQVLRSCTEFVECHGLVDGIYRLSGISSNIQKLRQEFDMEPSPDLSKEIYLQDIHCVSSLCKAYFRELPNPLLTYQLYDKFADAVAIQLEEGRLVKIKEVLKQLPSPHYRTLEFLMKHLVHMASFSSETNMHARNLAIVWAPNLLRSKDIEATGFNGTAAFMEVRIQSIVVEFILTHVDQLFQDAPLPAGENESNRRSFPLAGASGTLPSNTQDDLYFRSLSYNVPSILSQGDGPHQIRPYHTIIDICDHKRKGSLKVKKWKSIFNLGRSINDPKRKLNKHDEKDEKSSKMNLRPAKSMDSLNSMLSANEDLYGVRSGGTQKINIALQHESLCTHSKQEGSHRFKESDKHPNISCQNEEGIEGEASAKSEPTTPNPSRTSHMAYQQGRSPKGTKNRAEKCAGVHISGPFSVTVPFHITSNLTLSRLTRGLECPAMSNFLPDREEPEGRSLQEDMMPTMESVEIPNNNLEKPGVTEDSIDRVKEESLGNSENNRLSLEVQDTFSFLDSHINQAAGLPEKDLGDNHPIESHSLFSSQEVVPEYQTNDPCNMLEDDISSRFINDMIGLDLQMMEFSVEPPPDDMCSEDESDTMYFVPTGCSDNEERSSEEHEFSEEVFMSASDDLCPLIKDMNPLSDLLENHMCGIPGSEYKLKNISQEPAGHLSTGTLEEDRPMIAHTNHLPYEEASTLRMTAPNKSVYLEQGQKTTQCMILDEMPKKTCALPQQARSKNKIQDILIHTSPTSHQNDDRHIMAASSSHNEMDCLFNRPSTNSDRTVSFVDVEDVCTTEKQYYMPVTESGPKCEVAFNELYRALQTLNQRDMIESSVLQQCPYPQVDGVPKCDCPPEHAEDSLNNVIEKQVQNINEGTLTHLKMNDAQTFQGPNLSINCRTVRPQSTSEPFEKKKQPPKYLMGSVSMRLISTLAEIQQVKSVPVVPPKPLFAKLPPALKSKIHVGAASTGNKDSTASHSLKHNKPEKSHSIDLSEPIGSSLLKQQRSAWHNGGSVSFDSGQGKKILLYELPVRRMQTYCTDDSHEPNAASRSQKNVHVQNLCVKTLRTQNRESVSGINSQPSSKDLTLEKGQGHETPASLSLEFQ